MLYDQRKTSNGWRITFAVVVKVSGGLLCSKCLDVVVPRCKSLRQAIVIAKGKVKKSLNGFSRFATHAEKSKLSDDRPEYWLMEPADPDKARIEVNKIKSSKMVEVK